MWFELARRVATNRRRRNPRARMTSGASISASTGRSQRLMTGFPTRVAALMAVLVVGLLSSNSPATAQDGCCSQSKNCDSGCVSCCCPPTSCCDLWSRSSLTGDWLGHRTAMAERGIVFDADVTQFYQGVASGGLEQRFRYGGHGDYVVKFDFDKLSGQEGLFLQLRAEHRFGQAVNLDSGSFGAPAVLANLPAPVSYTHLTLPTSSVMCRSRWSPYH